MRYMIMAVIPEAIGNPGIKDGTLQPTVQKILTLSNPETLYFSVRNGLRTVYTVVSANEPSDIQPILEAWCLGVGANIEVNFAWTQEDMAKAEPRNEEIAKLFADSSNPSGHTQ